LAFGVPAVKISYDERASSLVETIGLGKWNIDMVLQDDVVAQIAQRIRRLDDLKLLRAQAQARWKHLEGKITDCFAQFAAEVTEYGQQSDSPSGYPRLHRNAA
jgi:polysaccharide pyruvyl transferase WcaK-like protein